jgi:hypothetical protein
MQQIILTETDTEFTNEQAVLWQNWCIDNSFGDTQDMPSAGMMIAFLFQMFGGLEIRYDKGYQKWYATIPEMSDSFNDKELVEALWQGVKYGLRQVIKHS